MSLYSALTQVLAQFAAKIKGIQTGYDGTEYNSPGEAVREQINDLHVLIGDEPGTAIQASAIAYNDSNVAAELTDVDERLGDLKTAFDEKVNGHYTTANPENWFNPSEETTGILYADGTTGETTNRCYTGYIPVTSGDVVRQYYGNAQMPPIYRRNICAYDAQKNILASKGTNSASNMGWTVPSGVSYIRMTFDKMYDDKAMITKNLVPTKYSAYFEPYDEIAEDFLTPESNAFLSNLMINGISSKNIINKYGNALPKTKIYQTLGLPQTWYYKSAITPENTKALLAAGSAYVSRTDKSVTFLNTTALSSANGYNWTQYDLFLNEIAKYTGNSGLGGARYFVAENLQNCSLLCIGDSTVDHDTMTATILSHFTEKGATVTLLGTLGDGSGTNKNEGRAGWKATDYLTNRQYNGVVNPFYNPTTETFDFTYYMQNQNYSGVDFVVLQLGINDLYNSGETAIEPTWVAMETIIDSILAYNSGIKIILNLPTTPNSDQSLLSVQEFLYRNRVIRYNEYAQAHALSKYGMAKVRCSYCHLILDPDTEIRDNVHPTAAGYAKMGLEVVNQINCWQAGV